MDGNLREQVLKYFKNLLGQLKFQKLKQTYYKNIFNDKQRFLKKMFWIDLIGLKDSSELLKILEPFEYSSNCYIGECRFRPVTNFKMYDFYDLENTF